MPRAWWRHVALGMPTPGCSSNSSDEGSQLDWAIAGYRACAQEALRFLIEQEQLPGNNPVVLGLWRHLALQELTMDVDSVMSQQAAEGDLPLHVPAEDEDPSGSSEEETSHQLRGQGQDLLISRDPQPSSDCPQSLVDTLPPVMPSCVNSAPIARRRTSPTAELCRRAQE
ncbi:hypothetical protein HPB49_016359 [Dermacentor silvarum]|uniref:Uncharacterized protein n=1 Tax=Dermacentor silvarum TaxID=543639 RepID=A0ACB8E1C5_DERSI|nr:hypothetical protein HPB49_016359 [Dermacentor silvarum]